MSPILITGLRKGYEWYFWLWEENRKLDMLRSLGRFASCSDLSFTWGDAAIVLKAMKELHEARERELTGPKPGRMR